MDILKSEIIIPAAAFLSVVAIGILVMLLWKRKKKMQDVKLQDSIWAGTDEAQPDRKTHFPKFLENIGNIASHGHASTTLWEQLIQAGYLGTRTPAIYTGIKMLLFVVGIVGTVILILPMEMNFAKKITLISLGGTIPFFIPNIVILIQRSKRRNEIRQHLPEAVDLLEICVSSGIGLDMAWNMVSNEIQHVSPVLAGEMALTNFEIHLGANRAESMRHMAGRTGAEELSSLASILIQTDRFGTSIAAALREFAASMRVERSFRAEEGAEKMAVKLVIIMVLFIFPAITVILAGPAAISIAKVMIFGD